MANPILFNDSSMVAKIKDCLTDSCLSGSQKPGWNDAKFPGEGITWVLENWII